jgi:uncharacterized membrane protein
MKRIVIFILFFISLVKAENINEYNVFIDIDNEGKLHIRENITYNFALLSRHGIFRDIPKKNTVITDIKTFRDGQIENFSTSYESNKISIKIGNADKIISGTHRYDLYYNMEHVVSKFSDSQNAIIFNAIGTEWKIPINSVNIYLNIPEKLSNSTLETFSGLYGSKTSKVEVKKLSNTSYLLSMDNLPPRNGITFKLTFDANLIKVTEPSNLWVYFFIVFFTIGLYFYWDKYGKDPSISSISPQYYPPENIDILEAGLLLDQYANEQDIPSAILYLASEGYLTIEVNGMDENGLISKVIDNFFSTKRIVLRKTDKSIENLSEHLKILYNSFFSLSTSFVVGEKKESTAIRLRNALKNISNILYNWSEKEQFMQKNPQKVRDNFTVLSILTALPFIIYSFIESYRVIGEDIFIMLFISIFLLVGVISFLKTTSLLHKLIIIFGFLIFPLISFVKIMPSFNTSFPLILIILVPIIFIRKYMAAHTRKGIQELRYLLGFKDFIQKVEKNRIKLFLKKDPNYIDRVLPYAVLFGVSDHWIEFYTELELSTPYWYSGNIHNISSLSDDLGKGFSSSSNYSESNSNSSGGFSGGGSGGGGGGSW